MADPLEYLPRRKRLYHGTPSWVQEGETFFITINARPRGLTQLTKFNVGSQILASVARLHHEHKWWCHLCLLMPDHLHGLFAFPFDVSMTRQIAAFKSFQARQSGIQWQDGFFDHRIRNDAEFKLKADYIRQNPGRAGLVKRAQDWPHVFEAPLA